MVSIGGFEFMRLETFEIKIGKDWCRVRGRLTPKGWLEWKGSDGSNGLCPPSKFRTTNSTKR